MYEQFPDHVLKNTDVDTPMNASQHFFYRLLQHDHADITQQQLSEQFPLMVGDDYLVGIFKTTDSADSKNYQELYAVLSPYKLSEYRYVMLPTAHGLVLIFAFQHIVPDPNKSPTFIGNRMDFHDHIRWFIQDLMDEAKQACSFSLKCFLSHPFPGLDGIHEAYCQAIEIASCCRLLDVADPIIMYSDYRKLTEFFPDRASITFMLNSFSRNFSSGQYEAANNVLRNLLESCFINAAPPLGMNHAFFRIVIGCVMSNYYMYAPTINTQHLRWFSHMLDSAANNEGDFFSIGNFQEGMFEIFQYLESDANRSCHTEKTVWLQTMIKYIDKNFRNRNLNLSTLAEHFQMSPSYISREVKKQYNKSLMAQIHEKRLNAAIELMSTDLTLTEIAEQCGFSSVRAMRHIFVKYKNKTPSEFRHVAEKKISQE